NNSSVTITCRIVNLNYYNCLAHAFDRPDLKFLWFDSVHGIPWDSISGQALLSALNAHAAFTQIMKNGIDRRNHHLFALDAENNHAFRYNSRTGVWSEKAGGSSARQWDDKGNALLDLDTAHWNKYQGSFSYFVINPEGFFAEPCIDPTYGEDPPYYAEARQKYYSEKIANFQMPPTL
ncbi:MAG: hypothetical protein ACPGRX_06950, partial [Bdellovibrionales bacterium]